MEHVSRALCEDVITFGRRSAEMGYVPNTQGNVSARDPKTGLIVISPHDTHYDVLTPEDLVIVDEYGNKIAGRGDPSYETPVHCTAYRERPDLFALVHTEPTYVGCLGAVGIPIDTVVASLLVNLGGPIPIMPYMPSGSDAFGHEMVRVMNGGYGVVWANHGLMTAGRTVEEAFRRTVIVEHAAQIYHLALLHGKPTIVTHEMFHGGVA